MPTKATIEVEIPDGWEFVRYDCCNDGEDYIEGDRVVRWFGSRCSGRYVIVRKAITYREPDARDVGKTIEVSNEVGYAKPVYVTQYYIGKSLNSCFVCENDPGATPTRWVYARVKVTP
jgi:hypothetical protein